MSRKALSRNPVREQAMREQASNKIISIVIPTYNSAATLEGTLRSIRLQNYDQEKLEILVIDGGSTDDTLKIAKKHGCKILANPKRQQEYAKHIGLLSAKGKLAVFLDSDEQFGNKDALVNREKLWKNYPQYKFILFGGYQKPPGASPINDYINIFGDPFAYFMTGIPGEAPLRQESWKKSLPVERETDDFIGFDLSGNRALPVVDLCAGNTLDLAYFKSEFHEYLEDPLLVPQAFYIVARHAKKVAMCKDDPIIHHSADSLKTYLGKLKWRVIVNTHFKDIPGTGFSNREKYQPRWRRVRKYIFPLYACTLVVPTIQAFSFAIKYKKPVLLIHPILCFYVAVEIGFNMLLKVLGRKPKLPAYGKEGELPQQE
ncbi:MAG: glycosyltransferase [Actinomycetota bacterium]|nr:glycosyltransferase [Actinomycetota bacterium]